MIKASGLGLSTRRGWIFHDVDLEVGRGELAVITGPAGSGRTALLLALAGRFRFTAGTLSVAGHHRARHIQRHAALGHVTSVHDPEPALTAAEHVAERLLLAGRRRRNAADVLDGYGYDLDPAALGRDLSPYRRHLLCLALARVAEPKVIMVDDVDLGLTAPERTALRWELRRLADSGLTIVATAREGFGGGFRQADLEITP